MDHSRPYGYMGYIESKGLNLRSLVYAEPDDPISPFKVADALNIHLIHLRDLYMLPRESLNHLLGEGSTKWDAVTLRVPQQGTYVILNPSRSTLRQKTTLMEEISHVYLNHDSSKIFTGTGTSTLFRTYLKDEEKEAFHVAAAALVPYSAIKKNIQNRKTAEQIAIQFQVTTELVAYRVKVTNLWSLYKRKSANRR